MILSNSVADDAYVRQYKRQVLKVDMELFI